MVLAKLYPLLPAMLKSPTDVLWSALDWCSYMGEGVLQCSLKFSPNVPADSPIYSSSHCNLLDLNHYVIPLICLIVTLSLSPTQMFFIVLPLLK